MLRTRTNRHFWHCSACGAQNSTMDGECQFCECTGSDCKRDSCSGVHHPGLECTSIGHAARLTADGHGAFCERCGETVA